MRKVSNVAGISLALCLVAFSRANAEAYYGHIDIAGYQLFDTKSHNEVLVDAFVPILQWPDSLLYVNFRGASRSKGAFEGNLGTGMRWLSADNRQLTGVYGFFDRRRTETGNSFNQTVIGGEYWFNRLFVGANAYIPIGKTEQRTDLFNYVDLIPVESDVMEDIYNLEAAPGFEKALIGFDAEVGYEVLPGLTTFVGGYMFTASEVEQVSGPKARLTYDWTHIAEGKKVWGIFDKISFESEVRHDQQRGTNWYGGLRFSVGLGTTPALDGVARHMLDPVRRDINLVTQGYHLDPELIKSLTIAEVDNRDDLFAANESKDINVILMTGDIAIQEALLLEDKTLTGYSLEIMTNAGEAMDVDLRPGREEVPVLSGEGAHNLLEVGSISMIYDVGLEVSNPGEYAAITNHYKDRDIEKLHVDNVYANGVMDIGLTGRGNTAQIWVNNSEFTTQGAQPRSATYEPKYDAAVNFSADGGAKINIESFQKNNIDTAATGMHGMSNDADVDGEINYTGYFGGNTIRVNGGETFAIDNAAHNKAQINFEKFVKGDNNLTATNNNHDEHTRDEKSEGGEISRTYVDDVGAPDPTNPGDNALTIERVASPEALLAALDDDSVDVVQLISNIDLSGVDPLFLDHGKILTSDRIRAVYGKGSERYDMLAPLAKGANYTLSGAALEVQVSQDNSILDLTIEDDSSTSSITNDTSADGYEGFGELYIDNVYIDGAIKLGLADGQSGTLWFVNNEVNTEGSSLSALDYEAAVQLEAADSAKFTVARFSGNTIESGDKIGVLNDAMDGAEIDYSEGVINNNITTKGNAAHAFYSRAEDRGSEIKFASFSGNEFETRGQGAHTFHAQTSGDDSAIITIDNFSAINDPNDSNSNSNRFKTLESDAGVDGSYLLFNDAEKGKIEYTGFENSSSVSIGNRRQVLNWGDGNVSYSPSTDDSNFLRILKVDSYDVLNRELGRDSNIEAILVDGEITLDGTLKMEGNTTITGGQFTFADTNNGGTKMTVQLADERGKLIAAEGDDLLTVVGQDNVIEGIELSVQTAGGIAINHESNGPSNPLDPLGLSLIDVYTTGSINIDVGGSGNIGNEVYFHNVTSEVKHFGKADDEKAAVKLTAQDDAELKVGFTGKNSITTENMIGLYTLAQGYGDLTLDNNDAESRRDTSKNEGHSLITIKTSGDGATAMKGVIGGVDVDGSNTGGALTIDNLSYDIKTEGNNARGVDFTVGNARDDIIDSESKPSSYNAINVLKINNSFIGGKIETEGAETADVVDAEADSHGFSLFVQNDGKVEINNSFQGTTINANGSAVLMDTCFFHQDCSTTENSFPDLDYTGVEAPEMLRITHSFNMNEDDNALTSTGEDNSTISIHAIGNSRIYIGDSFNDNTIISNGTKGSDVRSEGAHGVHMGAYSGSNIAMYRSIKDNDITSKQQGINILNQDAQNIYISESIQENEITIDNTNEVGIILMTESYYREAEIDLRDSIVGNTIETKGAYGIELGIAERGDNAQSNFRIGQDGKAALTGNIIKNGDEGKNEILFHATGYEQGAPKGQIKVDTTVGGSVEETNYYKDDDKDASITVDVMGADGSICGNISPEVEEC